MDRDYIAEAQIRFSFEIYYQGILNLITQKVEVNIFVCALGTEASRKAAASSDVAIICVISSELLSEL